MANRTGVKGNKGGKLSRNKMLAIDFSNFEAYAEKLERIGADLEKVVSNAMEHAAEKVQSDVSKALEPQYLPAKGKYRAAARDTEHAVIKDAKPERRGSVLEVPLGFDKRKPGAGGFLITGTPRMKPDAKLAAIFQRKAYAKEITNQIEDDLQKEIDKQMGSK